MKKTGANAVIGVQFDSSEIGYMTELLAYGTAVVVEKETEKQVRQARVKIVFFGFFTIVDNLRYFRRV